jgi:hypothetical protein
MEHHAYSNNIKLIFDSSEEIDSFGNGNGRFECKPFYTIDKLGYSLVLYFDQDSGKKLESRLDDSNKLVLLALGKEGKNALKTGEKRISCKNGNYSFDVFGPYLKD